MIYFWSFIISFVASLLAIIITFLIERKRMPNLIIVASEEANADNTYHGRGRWKFFRVSVSNKPFPMLLGWVPRQTAENCRPKVEFYDLNKKPLFGFNGRWASTPELPQLEHDHLLKLLYPDPVTIPVGDSEFLDIIVKYEKDEEAYGWNNEAYVYNWKTPHYKLNCGKYLIKVTINTQNGISFNDWFDLTVEETIKDTSLIGRKSSRSNIVKQELK